MLSLIKGPSSSNLLRVFETKIYVNNNFLSISCLFLYKKQESNEKETFSPKRPLNSKAKEYLQDKKGNRITQSGSSITSQNTPNVEKVSPTNFWKSMKQKEERSSSTSDLFPHI